MVRQAHEIQRSEPARRPPSDAARDVVSIRAALDEMATPRCPVCRMALIARMGRRGPGFYCLCARKKAA